MFLLINDGGFLPSPISSVFKSFELEIFVLLSVFIVFLFIKKKRIVKNNAFDFENKDVLNQSVKKTESPTLPFTKGSLKSSYRLFFILCFLLITLVFIAVVN